MTDLKDKNIIVTGASGGIGNSIIEKLNQAGANILASGTRIEKLEELKGKYGNIKILKFDISQSDKIEEFVENATKELGGSLDCIVNNAGITQDNLAIRMSFEEWQKVININLTSTFLISKSAIKKMLKNKYTNIKTLKFDISQCDKIEEFVENATKELGGNLDCIVNNAGITKDNLAIRMSLEEWQKVIDINLTSTFLISKSAIKKMLKNKSGKIVNITSVVGHTGNLGQANYTASKAGIIAMSKSLAIEYAKKNININCISPGFIKTAMTDKLDDKFKEAIISKIPSARLGEPDDIANAVLFLCSNQSSYINGETLHVNGGMYMA